MKLLASLLRNAGRKPATRRYPAEKHLPFAGTRGMLDITVAKCVFCGACQRACPAAAIAVERKTRTWTLDPYRCILCGYCLEVCPTKCLFFAEGHRAPG